MAALIGIALLIGLYVFRGFGPEGFRGGGFLLLVIVGLVWVLAIGATFNRDDWFGEGVAKQVEGKPWWYGLLLWLGSLPPWLRPLMTWRALLVAVLVLAFPAFVAVAFLASDVLVTMFRFVRSLSMHEGYQ